MAESRFKNPVTRLTLIGKIPTIAKIDTTQAILEQIKLTKEKFLEYFEEINTYPEKNHLQTYIPKKPPRPWPKSSGTSRSRPNTYKKPP